MTIPGSRVSVSALLLMLLTSCASNTDVASQHEPELPATLSIVDMSAFTLPLDSYLPTTEQHRVMYDAHIILIIRCMKRFGFQVKYDGAFEPIPGGKNERRYYLQSDARAQSYGYKWPEITNQKRAPEPVLEPGAETVLFGGGPSQADGLAVPDGGCKEEASRVLGLSNDESSSTVLVGRLISDSFHRMEVDSRVKTAQVRWSACMERAGYHYSDPAKANNDPSFATDTASAAEIATATTDVKCKKESSIINVMAAVESAYQRRSIDQYHQQLTAIQSQNIEQARIASDVIAGRK